MNTLTHPLDTLTGDGATHTLPDGRTLRCVIAPDHDYTVTGDGDWFGMLAPVTEDRHYYGRHTGRPDGFDGSAVILHDYNGERWWWQAPADVRDNPRTLGDLRACLLDAIHYGASVVALELCDGTDAYGAPIVQNYAITGSVLDAHDPVTLHDVLAGLLDDLCHDTGLDVPAYVYAPAAAVCGRCGDHFDGQHPLCPSCRTERED
jgi:hypothetical protein